MFEYLKVDGGAFDGPVLVTGAGGCIGSWVLALLSRAGVPVVAYDLSEDKHRPRLLSSDEELSAIPWFIGDIADTKAVADVVSENRIHAIIHLAALQVPFCVADPVAGARVNVVGTANVFEAARHNGVERLTYASSIAAHGVLSEQYKATLYGAYKYCDELIGKVYFEDWRVPSVGIRPGVVYGVGRDQGLTSKTTIAILAAAAGRPYTVPFTGPVSFLHAGEIAAAFIKAVSRVGGEGRVLDCNGVASTVKRSLEILREFVPEGMISAEGEALPFPADISDAPIRDYLGDYGSVPLEAGIEGTCEAFRDLIARNLVSPDSVQ